MTIGPDAALGSTISGTGTWERTQAMGLMGSCLCGAVRYEVDRPDMPIAHCHCRTCRKAHASAFAAKAGVLREHFRWLAGEDRLRAFKSSPGKQRWFCSTCGTHLLAERPAQPHVILRVATGRRPWRPSGHAHLDVARSAMAHGRRRRAALPGMAARPRPLTAEAT